VTLPVGAYEIREADGPSGYDQVSLVCSEGLSGSTVTLVKGAKVTCTFTNADRKPHHKTAQLKLIKAVENNHGGTAVPGDWSLQVLVDGTWQTVTQEQWVTLPVGAYEIREADGPSGYDPVSLVCSEGLSGSTVTLVKDATVTCTFTNADKKPPVDPAKLQLTKAVQNTYGGPAASTDWTLQVKIGDQWQTVAHNTWISLEPGTYELRETGGPDGYTQQSLTCTSGLDGSSVTLAAGAEVTCTFTNAENPPLEPLTPGLAVTGGGDGGAGGVLLGVLSILGGALLMAYGPLRRRGGGVPDRVV
jgi:plastocyanin domain-containing protein